MYRKGASVAQGSAFQETLAKRKYFVPQRPRPVESRGLPQPLRDECDGMSTSKVRPSKARESKSILGVGKPPRHNVPVAFTDIIRPLFPLSFVRRNWLRHDAVAITHVDLSIADGRHFATAMVRPSASLARCFWPIVTTALIVGQKRLPRLRNKQRRSLLFGKFSSSSVTRSEVRRKTCRAHFLISLAVASVLGGKRTADGPSLPTPIGMEVWLINHVSAGSNIFSRFGTPTPN